LYDKRDDFNFAIVDFRKYVATSHYHLHMAYIHVSLNGFDIQGRALHTISCWVEVDYWHTNWCSGISTVSFDASAFHKFYGRYSDLIYNFKLSMSHMLSDIFHTNSLIVLGELTLTAGNVAFMIMKLGSWDGDSEWDLLSCHDLEGWW
jgi:hypothetical protein